MFRHSILIFLRSFRRYKVTSFINLFGLSIGLASALLIYLWVNDELNMEQFKEQDSDRHFQVLRNSPHTTGILTEDTAPCPLAEALEKEFPEIEYAFPIAEDLEGVISFEEDLLRATPKFVGEGYLDVFACNLVVGEKSTAFSNSKNVLISERLANGLFQNANNAMGKTVNFQGSSYNDTYVVSGVFSFTNEPTRQFDMILSFDYYLAQFPFMDKWINGGIQSHVVLSKGVDVDQFNLKIKDYLATKLKDITETLFVQKYSDIYLFGRYENGVPIAGRIVYVRIFSLIAIFILIIACINYMNLSTAQATRRIKEIGVKKAIGAQRNSLMYQYFSESMFMTILSLILATGIVALLLPEFNNITGKELSIMQATGLGLPVLLITLFTGLTSGIYPGLYLSGFKPVLALKGKLSSGSGAFWLRKGLVIFQFAISVVLIVAVIVIYQQMSYIQTYNLGYDNEHILTFKKEGKLWDDAESFTTEVEKIPGVVKMSAMSGSLPGNISDRISLQWEGQIPEEKNTRFHYLQGGHDMPELLGVKLLEGRFFSREFPSDQLGLIMNQAAIDLIKYEDPIGKQFTMGRPHTIIGVIENFHFEGMQEKIKPFFFKLRTFGNNFMVKIGGQNQGEIIKRIEQLYNGFNPGYPFEFKFVDDNYQRLYEEERRIATLSKYFAGIAIAISCLGLLALTAFSTQRRFKEIAIRKVLGSSGFGIVGLLSREFIVLVIVAIVVALPIGYYLMKNWLDGFAYRIDLDPIYFAIAGLSMLAIAWLTVMAQTAKSARIKVTESLRGE